MEESEERDGLAFGVGSRRWSSDGLVAWLVRQGATTDYQEAADLLDDLTGLAVGPETIRRECVRVGSAIRNRRGGSDPPDPANTGQRRTTRSSARPAGAQSRVAHARTVPDPRRL